MRDPLIGHAGSCGAMASRITHQHILSTSRFLDGFWRLQRIVRLYRVGGSGLAVCVALRTLIVVWVVLGVIGISGTDCSSLRFGGSQRSWVTEDSPPNVLLT